MRPPIDFGTVLITGACSVLGQELARQLAPRARTLVLVCPHAERLDTLSEELQAYNPTLGMMLLPADLSRPGEVDRVMAEMARHLITPGVLVNASGGRPRVSFAQQSWEDVEQTLQAQLVAPLRLAHRLLPAMIARNRGGILHVGSGLSQLFLPGFAAVVASHRGMDGFFESLRLEVEGSGIVLTYAAPGPVLAPRSEEADTGQEHAPFCRISAQRCAREMLAGFDRAEALVYPGTGHPWVMGLMHLLPRALRRALGRLSASPRAGKRPRLEAPRPEQPLLAPG
jgi:uncharacterized protein